MMKYKTHPVADLFPLIEEGSRDWNDLLVSIKDHGQIDPIVLDGDVLLDGRNRLRACDALKIEPKTVQFDSLNLHIDKSEWIAAKNLERRSLTADQKAEIAFAVDALMFEQKAAEQKKRTQFKPGSNGGPGRGKKTVTQKPAEPKKRNKETKERVAEKAGVSRYKVEQVQKVDKAVKEGKLSAQVKEDIRTGKTKLKEAVKQIPKTKHKSTPSLHDQVCDALNKLISKFHEKDREEVKAIIRQQIL